MPKRRSHIFVSYSHADREHLRRLRVHLRPFEREGTVEVWADSKIVPGSNWRQEIKKAIDKAAAAICLISADFLASDFIAENELPPLLQGAADQGVEILPVILKPCAFTDIKELAVFQAVNDPSNPLVGLEECEQEKVWYQVAVTARDALQQPVHAADMRGEDSSKEEYETDFDDSFEVECWALGADDIEKYAVYQYHHIDDLSFMLDAEEVLRRNENREKILSRVRERFRHAGWEGDGRLQILWLPPFLGAGVEDTYGVVVWHVKQSNNGTSWLASPVPLPFERLLYQNDFRPR